MGKIKKTLAAPALEENYFLYLGFGFHVRWFIPLIKVLY